MRFVEKHWPIITLLVISTILFFTNYTPGTFFSGWDTLHPEFNFPLNFQRLLSGVFLPYQGLGAVAGHSEMSDLPRIFILYIFHFFFPLSFLRYSYLWLTMLLGPVGMYFFLRRCIFVSKTNIHIAASFLGGLLYLLNLGTMQQYVVAFEMFNTLFAFLPWLMLYATEYIVVTHKSRKTLLYFSIATIFASPMAYAATLWYAYFLLLCVYILFLCIVYWQTLAKKTLLKKAGIILGSTLVLNSYWLLPNMYFVLYHGKEVQEAYTNQLFSPQAFLYNKEFGTLIDLLLQRSFLFDWSVYAGNNQFVQLLQPWKEYLQNPWIFGIGILWGLLAIVGLILAASKYKKNKIAIALIPVLLCTLFFLINHNFPTGAIYTFLQEKFPLFQEGLRFPHTKFYLHYTFLFTVFFALGINSLLQLSKRYKPALQKTLLSLGTILVTFLLIIFMLPGFAGQFISSSMRITIPQEYFTMFNWFNSQSNMGRVAPLPINSFWGWDYYDWYGNQQPSFQGAGFLWFDIKQPFLARDFDRWTPYNEDYYKQMSTAVYSESPTLLKSVVQQYNLGYLLVDTDLVAPQYDKQVLFLTQMKTLFAKSPFLEKPKQFGNHLFVYQVKHLASTTDTALVSQPQSVSPATPNTYQDIAFTKDGDYITKASNNTQNYPFRSFVDNQGTLLPKLYTLSQDGMQLHMPQGSVNTFQGLQTYYAQESLIPAAIFVKRDTTSLTISLYPLSPFVGSINAPAPIIDKVLLPASVINPIVSINKTLIFNVHDISPDVIYAIGKTTLFTHDTNSVAVYSDKPDTTISPQFATLPYSLRSCDTVNNSQIFSLQFDTNPAGIHLSGKQVPLCFSLPITSLLAQNLTDSQTLIGMTYSVNSQNGENNANICESDIKNGACKNYISQLTPSSSTTSLLPSYFAVSPQEAGTTALRFFFDTSKSTTIISAHFGNISFTTSKPVSYTEFSAQTIEQSIAAANVQPQETANRVLIPYTGLPALSQNIIAVPKTTGSCGASDFAPHVGTNKQIIQSQNSYIRYTSTEGSLCDHYSYQNLFQNQAYILLASSRNVSGLPMTLCVTNQYSKRCDEYTDSTMNKTFTTSALFIPPVTNNQYGYDINISDLGIKETPGINDLQSLQLIPFPYHWLINLTTTNQTATTNQQSSLSSLTSSQPGGNVYVVQLQQQAMPSPSYLVLQQSFENGWKAYQLNNSTSNWLNQAFPFFFGTALTDHVLVDNWANGWELPIQITNNQSPITNNNIVILFWPQYLEYIGLGLLLCFCGGIGIHFIRSKNK